MANNQGDRQQSVRNFTGTAGTYEGDWHALFDAKGVPAGDFNGRLLTWINIRLGSSYTNLPGAQAAFAAFVGVPSWNELGTFVASPTVGGAHPTYFIYGF